MPEQKHSPPFFLQRHSIPPILLGSRAGANDGEQYLCKDLEVNASYNRNYKACFTGSALLLNKTVKTDVEKAIKVQCMLRNTQSLGLPVGR